MERERDSWGPQRKEILENKGWFSLTSCQQLRQILASPPPIRSLPKFTQQIKLTYMIHPSFALASLTLKSQEDSILISKTQWKWTNPTSYHMTTAATSQYKSSFLLLNKLKLPMGISRRDNLKTHAQPIRINRFIFNPNKTKSYLYIKCRLKLPNILR